MIKIQQTPNLYETQNIDFDKIKTQSLKNNFAAGKDMVSFKGSIIRPIVNKSEAKEIVLMFCKTVEANIDKSPQKQSFFGRILNNIACFPFIRASQSPNSITEIVKNNDKLVGGYSMIVNMEKSSAHIGFITLSPELQRTKSGFKILLDLAERISLNSELNKIKEITWTCNQSNELAHRLLGRFNAEKVKSFANETEYRIDIKDFQDALKKISSKF